MSPPATHYDCVRARYEPGIVYWLRVAQDAGMIALSLFALLTVLAVAPFAGWRIADRKASKDKIWSLAAMLAALVSLAAVLAGLFARSAGVSNALLSVETGGMLFAAILIARAAIERVGVPGQVRNLLMPTVAVGAGWLAIVALVGLRVEGAASLCWMGATGFAGCAAIGRRAASPSIALVDDILILTVAGFLVVHLAQLVQLVGPGGLQAVVPLTSLAAIAAMIFVGAYRLGRPALAAYRKSALDDRSAADLFSRIEACMADTKPYRSFDFDRTALAALIGSNPRDVGEAINRAAGLSFPAYIRDLRLAEADRLLGLEENREVSLEALGMEAGFRSRSSFYSAYADAHGISPGDRRMRLHKNRVRA